MKVRTIKKSGWQVRLPTKGWTGLFFESCMDSNGATAPSEVRVVSMWTNSRRETMITEFISGAPDLKTATDMLRNAGEVNKSIGEYKLRKAP